MRRYLCWLAVLGVVAIPDWASAFYHRRCLPVCQPAPVYCPPPPMVVAPPCVPVYEIPLAPPRVYAIPAVTSKVTPATPPAVAAALTPTPPAVPRPPAPSAPAPASPPAVATPAPAPDPEPMFRPAGGPVLTNDPPRPAAGLEPVPMLPPAPKPPPGSSTLDLPKLPVAETGGSAVPTPAPPPGPEPGSLIPPAEPKIPESPEARKPAASSEALPPLVLPPETGGNAGTTSKASPLAAARGLRVQVFPASGSAPTGAVRKIGFYNHTGRDLELMIEGRSVTLPGKSYITAQVPPTFRWGYSGNPAAAVTVPADAVGLDVLFRE